MGVWRCVVRRTVVSVLYRFIKNEWNICWIDCGVFGCVNGWMSGLLKGKVLYLSTACWSCVRE